MAIDPDLDPRHDVRRLPTSATHADEIDTLRLQNAALQLEATVCRAQLAAASAEAARLEWEKALAAAERKYGFTHPQEGINYATREIVRAVRHGD